MDLDTVRLTSATKNIYVDLSLETVFFWKNSKLQ